MEARTFIRRALAVPAVGPRLSRWQVVAVSVWICDQENLVKHLGEQTAFWRKLSSRAIMSILFPSHSQTGPNKVVRPHEHAMKTESIKLRWAFLAMLATFPVTGAICAICYHSISMFYVSLISVPIAAIVFPAVFVGMRLLPVLLIRSVVSVVMRTHRFFTRK